MKTRRERFPAATGNTGWVYFDILMVVVFNFQSEIIYFHFFSAVEHFRAFRKNVSGKTKKIRDRTCGARFVRRQFGMKVNERTKLLVIDDGGAAGKLSWRDRGGEDGRSPELCPLPGTSFGVLPEHVTDGTGWWHLELRYNVMTIYKVGVTHIWNLKEFFNLVLPILILINKVHKRRKPHTECREQMIKFSRTFKFPEIVNLSRNHVKMFTIFWTVLTKSGTNFMLKSLDTIFAWWRCVPGFVFRF